MVFFVVTGCFCILSIVAFLLLVKSGGNGGNAKVFPLREQEFKNLFGINGFRRDFVDTDGGIIAFYRIMPNNMTVLPEAVIEYQIEQMKQLLQNEDDLSVFCTDGSEIGEENVRFFKKRIAEEIRPEIREILRKDLEFFESTHRQKTSLKQFFILLTMDPSWTDEMLYTRASEIGKKLHEHGFANSMLEQSGIRHLLGIFFSGSMYAERWKEEDFYEYVTRDREREERNGQEERQGREYSESLWDFPPIPTEAKRTIAAQAIREVETIGRENLSKKEAKSVRKKEKKENQRKEALRREAERKNEAERKSRERDRKKEEYEFSLF